MRHAVRHFFTILSALSLLLCVATCVLWVRGHYYEDRWMRRWKSEDSYHQWLAASFKGLVYFRATSFSTVTYVDASLPARTNGIEHLAIRLTDASRLPSERFDFYNEDDQFRITVRCWFLAISTLLLPALAGMRYWSHRQRKVEGLCLICGYDLRAGQRRCPECGTVREREAVKRCNSVLPRHRFTVSLLHWI